MKNSKVLIAVSLFFTVIILFLSILDVLALSDIQRDYVSQKVLQEEGILLSSELPAWTATVGEWQVVSLGVYARLPFLLLNTGTLWICWKILHGTSAEGH